jgi:hypothetical protein
LFLYLLGPLERTHEDLWKLTPGEASDLMAAHRFKEYKEYRKIALLGTWILAPWSKRSYNVEDLVGVWNGGEIVSKAENYRRVKERIKRKKRRKRGEEENGKDQKAVGHRRG